MTEHKQSGELSGKEANKLFFTPLSSLVSECPSGCDSAYSIPALWQLPVTQSEQSALVMDVMRRMRCHLHIVLH